MISPPFIRRGRRGRRRAEQLRRGAKRSEVRDETARGGISQVNKGHYEDFSHRGGKLSCRSLFTCARADLQLSCAGPPRGRCASFSRFKEPSTAGPELLKL